jgi:hypothetical protein
MIWIVRDNHILYSGSKKVCVRQVYVCNIVVRKQQK